MEKQNVSANGQIEKNKVLEVMNAELSEFVEETVVRASKLNLDLLLAVGSVTGTYDIRGTGTLHRLLGLSTAARITLEANYKASLEQAGSSNAK